MKVSPETWDEIVMMTKAGIATWQATAEAKGLPDQFTVHTGNKGGRTALLTRHVVNGHEVKAVCVMRYDATGSIFPCKLDKKAKKWMARPAPQSWIRLTGAATETIWKKLRLCDFAMASAPERVNA